MPDKSVAPRRPDYRVAALDRRTEFKGNVGVAWKNNDGTIAIRLNGFTTLDTGRQDLVITLFPNDRDHDE